MLNVNFSSANLSSAYLYKADLTGANLQNADLRNAYFSQANLTSAYLGGALCCGTYFKDAELKFANLKTAKFSHKTMIDLKWYSVWEIVNRGAAKKNLSGVDLSNANLQGVDFEEANLTNAKLNNAILRRSNLNNANLTNTDLMGANVCGVDLDQANLKGAKLKSVISDRHTQLSLRGNSHKTNLMVKERPATKATPEDSTRIQHSQEQNLQAIAASPNKKKSTPNVLGILFLGIVAMVTAAGYVFWTQNPEYSWREQIEAGKVKLEQLMP
ncbi:MAG: pentapeptide repeat-containing protein [Cyanobacteria bacterium J06631_2]